MLAQRDLDSDPVFEQLVAGVVEAVFGAFGNIKSRATPGALCAPPSRCAPTR